MIPGVDTNHWEGYVDSKVMASRGIKWNIAKFTDFDAWTKKGFQDSQFDNTYQGHKEHGIKIGGWHWLQPGVDPTVQAHYYLENWHKYKMDIDPCLDFEDKHFTSPTDYLWRAQVWLDVVEKETGQKPIVYTAKWFMDYFDKTKVGWLARYPLWVAHYTLLRPSVPYPWSTWSIWQYSETGDGQYYGCDSKAIDLDYMQPEYWQGEIEVKKFRPKYIHWYYGIIPWKMR